MLIYRLYQIIGSIYVAIFLMVSLAVSIAIGTWIESATDSHRQAARWIYQSPLFAGLLLLLFCNILFSATKRWPFRLKHIPFLLAHLGLLMVVGGVLIKQFFGVQGTIHLVEGTGSHLLALNDTLALRIEKRPYQIGQEPENSYYPIERDLFGRLNPLIKVADAFAPELEVHLLRYWPHAIATTESWIKGDRLWVAGSAPMELKGEEIIGTIRQSPFLPAWQVYAWKSVDVEKDIQELLHKISNLSISDRETDQPMLSGKMDELLKEPFTLGKKSFKLTSAISYPLEQGIQAAAIELHSLEDSSWTHLSLYGPEALLSKQKESWQSPAYKISLKLPPTLAFLEDLQGTLHLIAISQDGELFAKQFPRDQLGTLLLFERGFGGYGVQAEIPLKNRYADGKARRQALLYHRLNYIKAALSQKMELLPPLELLKKAAFKAKRDFSSLFIELMAHWENSGSWVVTDDLAFSEELKSTLDSVDWSKEDPALMRACDWICQIFKDLESTSTSKKTLERLSDKNWPLVAELEEHFKTGYDELECRRLLAEQIAACGSYLPAVEGDQAISSVARLTAYLRLHDFGWHHLLQLSDQENIQDFLQQWQIALLLQHDLSDFLKPIPAAQQRQALSLLPDENPLMEKIKQHVSSLTKQEVAKERQELLDLVDSLLPPAWMESLGVERSELAEVVSNPLLKLETSLSTHYRTFPASVKLEDNRPLVSLLFKKGKHVEQVALGFDPNGHLFKQPILGGEYRVHLEWMKEELPYHIRLLDAKQVVHPQSTQTLSYESKIEVTDRETGDVEEAWLSMNQVHEAAKGYRFYLSGLAPAQEIAPRKVHLVVNRDPVRWWLTYPGAFFISIGTVLLLTLQPYSRKRRL